MCVGKISYLIPKLIISGYPGPSSSNDHKKKIEEIELDWNHIETMDKRISIDKTNFLKNFSPEEIQALFKYLVIQVKAIHQIEKEVREKYGISETFKKIKILAPGPLNNALASTNHLEFLLGNPKEYEQFFISPTSTYAHELGHYLENFDVKGRNRLPEMPMAADMIQIFKNSLTPDGVLKGKYLDVPYNLLPNQLLFPSKVNTNRLFYYAGELVADKVSLQLCGYDETKKRIKVKVKKKIASQNPWELMHLWVLAHKYSLRDFEKELFNKLMEHKAEWENVISTQELLNSLSEFFDKVSLKHIDH